MFNVYFRNNDGTLGHFKVEDVEDHEEAILNVQESLVSDGTGYNEPVLVLINGGKK